MIGLLLNPNSRKNRHKPSRVRRLEKILGRHGCVIETPSVDSIIPALKRFADEGRTYWIADGGDGALHWMVNEAVRYFGQQRAVEQAVFVPTGGGTIDFVAHAVGLEGTPQEVVARLVSAIADGRTPRIVDVPVVSLEGTQIEYGDQVRPWRRVGFGCALAGYGANFFGPLYRGNKEYGAPRIAKLLTLALSAGAVRATLRGPFERAKPAFLAQAEHDFLRTLRAEVSIDGVILRGSDGLPVREHTVLHAGSIPVNLANILRVFPGAGSGRMHVHAGNVTVAQFARMLPQIVTGRSVNHLMTDAIDGTAATMEIVCATGEEMTPVLDGEVFHRITHVRASVVSGLRIAVP
jgi:hypothetical protein